MKYLFFIICVFLCQSVLGQWRPQAYFMQYEGIKAPKIIELPRDTLYASPSGNSDTGRIAIKNKALLYKGAEWEIVPRDASIKLSYFGAYGDTSIDGTATLNAAIAYCKKKQIKYLEIDKDVKVNGRVTFDKSRVLLRGFGKIYSYNLDNYGETESGGEYTFVSSANTPWNSFSKTAGKIQAGDTVTIVVWGDSISDGYDFDFTDIRNKPVLVNQISSADSWYELFVREMYAKYRNKPIKIINRSAGGYGMNDLVRQLKNFCCGSVSRFMTPTNQDSTWISVIRDAKPDLLLITLGMNNGDEYIKYFYDALDSIKTWPKKPEIVLMSTPSTNYIDDPTYGDYGDYAHRVQKMQVGIQQRWISENEKLYLMDAGRLHDVNRYGADYSRYTLGPTSGYYLSGTGGFSKTNDQNFTISATGFSSINVNRKNPTSDYGYTTNWSYAGTFAALDFTNSKYLTVRLTPTTVELYPFVQPGKNINFKSANFTFSAGVTYKLDVQVTSEAVRLYVNDSLIVTTAGGGVSEINIPKVELWGNSGTHTFSSFSPLEANYTKYFPTLTGTEMWGPVVASTNGNAINHPSREGLSKVYFPVVREFLLDLDATVASYAPKGILGFNMGGGLGNPISAPKWGVSWTANSDSANIYFQSTGDEDGSSSLVLQVGDNRTGTGGADEGVIFRKSGSGDTPATGTIDMMKIVESGVAITGKRLRLGLIDIVSGVGNPNGIVSAPIGSIYLNESGGTGSTLYIRETGGATNWTAK